MSIMKWIISILFISFFCNVRGGRPFYRSWGLQANGTLIKNITSVTSAEDCLHYCYVTEGCKSFNTFDVGKGEHKCQLFSNDICDLDPNNGMTKNPLASVFFSKNIEDCIWVQPRTLPNPIFGFICIVRVGIVWCKTKTWNINLLKRKIAFDSL